MRPFWRKNWFLWLVYGVLAVVASGLKLGAPAGPNGYTAYENYRIFKNAFGHLLAGQNPYAAYPAETWDLYKYSPAFAIFMGPFTVLPDALGLPLWNLLNAFVLLSAILYLPVLRLSQRHFIAWFVLLELLTSMQNSQSNGLTAGLILWSFIAFERGHMARAGAWISANAFIKIFGGVGVLMAWLYPKKIQFLGWALIFSIFLTILPVFLLGFSLTVQNYRWWLGLLQNDHATSTGLSVQGWLESWFGWFPSKIAVLLTGVVIFMGSIWQAQRHAADSFPIRALAWASLLIWVVIFNHKAESPTFIIAVCGAALWYCVSAQRPWEKALLAVLFILVSLSPTDLFPRYLRTQVVQPYVLKAVPCILLWGIISWKLLAGPRLSATGPAS